MTSITLSRIITAAVLSMVFNIAVSADELPAKKTEKGSIEIDAKKVVFQMNPLLFGQNIEAADGKDIFSKESRPANGDGFWDVKNKVPEPMNVQLAKDIGTSVMRWPGGCLVHNFDWKKTVGPVSERPMFAFGLDEYIQYCRAINAEPLINVAFYVGEPADKAELVEYCNAPATPDHPWAMKRAEWGHKEPYGVKYFEMGNEEDHGNHDVKPFKKYNAQQYGEWFVECAKLMKKVDPKIQMGAHMGTGTGPYDNWNKTVCQLTKDCVDFIIIHTYQVGLWKDGGDKFPADQLMRACMAGPDDFDEMLSEYNRIIFENTGRHVPIAITEYNASFVQDKPIPYRFSFGGALFVADYIRILMQPKHNILMANYWQFVNGYWGLIQGRGDKYKKQPAYYTLRLWAQHFGKDVLETKIDAPKLDFEGCLKVNPRRSKPAKPLQITGFDIKGGSGKGAAWASEGKDAMVADLKGYSGETYPEITHVELTPGRYRFSFKAKIEGDTGGVNIGLGLCDDRGWDKTRSAIGIHGLVDAKDWQDFSGEISTLNDCKGVVMVWRFIGKPGMTANAKVAVKDMEIKSVEERPPYSMLTASSSLSADGKTLYLIVFNKHTLNDISTTVKVSGVSVSSAKIWTVNGPSLESVNVREETVKEVLSGEEIKTEASGFTYIFPAHSMSAVELKVK